MNKEEVLDIITMIADGIDPFGVKVSERKQRSITITCTLLKLELGSFKHRVPVCCGMLDIDDHNCMNTEKKFD